MAFLVIMPQWEPQPSPPSYKLQLEHPHPGQCLQRAPTRARALWRGRVSKLPWSPPSPPEQNPRSPSAWTFIHCGKSHLLLPNPPPTSSSTCAGALETQHIDSFTGPSFILYAMAGAGGVWYLVSSFSSLLCTRPFPSRVMT